MATSDADKSVRVATIILLDNIRNQDLLEPEDVDKLSLMIFDPELRIRRAVVNIFLSNVEATFEETCEGIGGNVDAVEKELGDEKESADGIPLTWLRYNALAKVLAKYDRLVEEEQDSEDGDSGKLPYRGFDFGEIESRISMAASAIITEMNELKVPPPLNLLLPIASGTNFVGLGQFGVVFITRSFFPTKRKRTERK